MSRPTRAYRSPVVDARLLLLAAALAAPAAYRASEGLIPFDDAVDRFLLIAAGCFAVSALLRTVWPFLVGDEQAPPDPGGTPVPTAAAPGTAPQDGAPPPALGNGLDLLEDDLDPLLLLEAGPGAAAELPA
jgi:hypothetical protein